VGDASSRLEDPFVGCIEVKVTFLITMLSYTRQRMPVAFTKVNSLQT
jgi:hypothetical protein